MAEIVSSLPRANTLTNAMCTRHSPQKELCMPKNFKRRRAALSIMEYISK